MQLRNTSKYLSDDDVRCFMINQLSDGEKLDMVDQRFENVSLHGLQSLIDI